MPTYEYQATCLASLNEEIQINLQASSIHEAKTLARETVFEIVLAHLNDFATLQVEVSDIIETSPTSTNEYTPLTSNTQQYTSLAQLFNKDTQSNSSYQKYS